MGACCTICFNKSFYGIELSHDISKNLEELMRKIKWSDSFLNEPRVKLGNDIQMKISSEIVKNIKKNGISVFNINGFVQEYIAMNIACFIFHRIIWDIINIPLNNEMAIIEDNNYYPPFVPISQNYKDIYSNLKLNSYFTQFEGRNIEMFKNEFSKRYNIEGELNNNINREVLEINLENYITETIESILTNDNILAFNHNDYMNTMLNKQTIYETDVKNRT
jgi:hypothetical protein